MPTHGSRVDEIERHIAFARVTLSLAALVSIWVDWTVPDLGGWVSVSGGLFMIDRPAMLVLGAHLLYGIVLCGLQLVMPDWRVWTVRLTTILDVGFGVAVSVVTEGATSPAFVFFAFAIMAAGCRAGLRTVLMVTAACVIAYLAIIIGSAQHGGDVYMMRPAYLAITGYLIAYLAQRRLDCERRAYQAETRAERRDIARALHDGYVQALAAVNLRLGNCRVLLERGRHADVQTELGALQAGVRHEFDAVRAYVRSLAAVGRSKESAEARDLSCTVMAEVSGSAFIVEQALQIMLEGIRNARRHARATSTAIKAECSSGALRIVIEDDGVGFDPEAEVPWTIASRVRDCGGAVHLSAPSLPGARVIVDLPAAWGMP